MSKQTTESRAEARPTAGPAASDAASGRRPPWDAAVVATWTCAAWAALLPFHALGPVRARQWLHAEPADIALLLGAPAVARVAWRQRQRLATCPLILSLGGLALVQLARELCAAHPAPSSLARPLLDFGALVAVTTTVWNGSRARLLHAAGVGAVVAFAISAVGLALTQGTDGGGFVFVSRHPLFGGVPRLVGTFGTHAVWMGEYCLALLALSLAGAQRGSRAGGYHALALASGLGLLLTFSFAWVGGGLLALVWLRHRPAAPLALRRLAAPTWGVGFVLAVWLVVVGLPVPPTTHGPSAAHDVSTAGVPHAVDCRDFDHAHHLSLRTDAGRCQAILATTPYPHARTLYALAHETALAAVAAHPLWGTGHSSYAAFARGYAQGRHGLGDTGYYTQPIGLFAATLAQTGLLGAALLASALLALWRMRPRAEPTGGAIDWVYWGAVALIPTSVTSDLTLRGPLWLLLGCALAGWKRSRERVGAPP